MAQRGRKKEYAVLCFFAASLVFSIAVNFAVHRLDNKYEYSEKQPVCGVMELTEADLSGRVNYLCDDWEIYRGVLLTPDDFRKPGGGPLPDEYVRLGQYPGFETGGDAAGSGHGAHGSATYRLRLLLPETPARYELELPEIFSAYRLWAGGKTVFQSGDPDPADYSPRLVQTKISFEAAGETELLFQVSDFSHYYSGIVYPPAFGSEQNVERLLSGRLALKTIQCFFAALLCLCYAALWAVNRGDRKPLCFSLICAGYLGYASYLPIHTFLPSGSFFWYRMEDFCFLFLLFFLCTLAGVLWRAVPLPGLRCLQGFIAAMMAASLIVPSFFGTGGLPLMRAYGFFMDACQFIVVAWLILGCCRVCLLGMAAGRGLLFALLFFGVALAGDRMDYWYEPVLLGWGSEYGGFVLLCVLASLVVMESIAARRENMELIENEARKEIYMREIVHDLRSPLALITTYAQLSRLGVAEDEKQQSEFLSEIEARAKELSERIGRLRRMDPTELSNMNFVTVDSLEYLGSLRDKYSALLAGKGLDLLVAGEHFSLRLDREKMDMAMENLIMNSMRFTEAGGTVTLEARVRGGRKELRLRDTGAGMDEEYLNRIFERGFTGDRTEHTGLGLSIVTRIAAAHGSSVEVESRPGRGSCFILRFQ